MYILCSVAIRFCFAVIESWGALLLGGPRQLPSVPILKAGPDNWLNMEELVEYMSVSL